MLSQDIARTLLIGINRLREELVRSIELPHHPGVVSRTMSGAEATAQPIADEILSPSLETDTSCWYYAVEDVLEPNLRAGLPAEQRLRRRS